ncbi:unnamed protein product, partial [Rotaria socialis]
MLMIINDPTIFMRIVMMIMSVATGVGVVTSGIVVGTIVSKQIAEFQNTEVVLKSQATIVLNRYLELIELPLFYDVLTTLTLFNNDVETVLTAKFGENFAHLEIVSFPPTLKITSSRKRRSRSKRRFFKKYDDNYNSDPHTSSPSSSTTPRATTTTTTTTTTATKAAVIAHTETMSTSSTAKATTTTIDTNNNTTHCNATNNAAAQSTILSSEVFLYFVVKNGESIQIQAIRDALQDLETPVTVLTQCGEPSTRKSSFNAALSIVEASTKVDVTSDSVKAQPSVAGSLKENVNAAAQIAIQIAAEEYGFLLSESTTTTSTQTAPSTTTSTQTAPSTTTSTQTAPSTTTSTPTAPSTT